MAFTLPRAMLCAAVLAGVLPAQNLRAVALRDVVGVAHISPRYNPKLPGPVEEDDKRDILNEGAQEILDMGSRVIEIIVNPNPGAFYYPTQNPAWQHTNFDYLPEDRLTEVINPSINPQFHELFQKDFSTFIISIKANIPVMVRNQAGGLDEDKTLFSFAGLPADPAREIAFGAPLFDGFTPAERAIEKAAIKKFAAYLLRTYASSGKTFVIVAGELDWLGREPDMFNENYEISPARMAIMIDWLNARQEGVTEARNEARADGITGVQVVNSVEVNRIADAISGAHPAVTNDVIPYTNLDLYSLGTFDFDRTDVGAFIQHLDYLAGKAPDSALYGARNIFVAEYAYGENVDAGNPAQRATVIRRLTEAALAWGVRYLVFWQFWDNEIRSQYVPASPCNPAVSLCPNEYPENGEMNGHWLAKPVPDPTDPYVNVYYYFRDTILPASITYAGLKTANAFYVSADDGGGGLVHASAPWLRSWERFAVFDENGGDLVSGDAVHLLTSNGFFLMAPYGGGEGVEATATHGLSWETFTILRQFGGGTIGHGDVVAFKTETDHYFVAEGGGGSNELLNANRTAVGAWERFTIVDLASCTCTLSPSAQTVTASTTSTTLSLATGTACEWQTRTDTPFLSTPSSGLGSGTLPVSIATYAGSASRTGAVLVTSWSGGAIATVTQTPPPPPGGALNPPAGLAAAAQSTNAVLVTWQPSPNAAAYEVWRSTGGAYGLVSTNGSSPALDLGVAPNTTYLYKVRATNGSSISAFSNVDFATTILFTDDPVTPGMPIRAEYLNQLRMATNALRAAAGLGTGSFTDNPLVVNATRIKVAHVQEIRTLLSQAISALGMLAPTFTDPTLVSLGNVKAVYVQELRNAVK